METPRLAAPHQTALDPAGRAESGTARIVESPPLTALAEIAIGRRVCSVARRRTAQARVMLRSALGNLPAVA